MRTHTPAPTVPSPSEQGTRVRQILTLGDDSPTPSIEAAELWELLGKPYQICSVWAEQFIKPLLPSEGVTALQVPSLRAGKSKQGYRISRRVAVGIALTTRTPTGQAVRDHFLDLIATH